MQERIGYEHQRPVFSNGGSVSHAIIVKTKQLLAILVKSLNRPTKQVGGNNLLGIPTEMVGHQSLQDLTPSVVYQKGLPAVGLPSSEHHHYVKCIHFIFADLWS